MSRRTTAPLVAGLALALTAISLPAAALPLDDALNHIVIYPGSQEVRYVDVTNTAPAAGTMTVSIVNAEGDFANERDDVFFDEMFINGIRASDLEGTETVIHTQYTEQGETITLPFTVTFSGDATGANAAISGDHIFAFDLRVTLQDSTVTPTPTPTPTPAGPGTTTRTTTGTTAGPTATTGGTIDDIDWRLLAGAALLSALAAVVARTALRHRTTT